MQAVLERLDSRRGIVGFLVVVSLLAGLFVVSAEVGAGNRGAVWDFLLFVLVFGGASVYGRQYVENRSNVAEEDESTDRC